MRAVVKALGIELVEMPGAACCGAGVMKQANHKLQLTLNARTFAQAEAMGLDKPGGALGDAAHLLGALDGDGQGVDREGVDLDLVGGELVVPAEGLLVEVFIDARSEARFSHGFCPGCIDRYRTTRAIGQDKVS